MLPYDFSLSLPIKAKQWLHKYEITELEQKTFGIGWSEQLERLILPVYQNETLIYWQGRTFKPISKQNAKYLNIRQSGAKNVFFTRTHRSGSVNVDTLGTCVIDPTSLVIVEDILSAIKVGRQFNSLALLGSYIPDALVMLLGSYQRIYLWLDDDKFSTSLKTMRRLTQVTGKPIIPIKTPKDPKEYSDQEIKHYLKGEYHAV